jgi:hypothetical protein
MPIVQNAEAAALNGLKNACLSIVLLADRNTFPVVEEQAMVALQL